MTLPTADLISEVLRLDEALAAWVNLPAVDRNPMEGLRLMGDIAKHAPELARRLRDAEEKLARANEALKASEALVARLDFVHEDRHWSAARFFAVVFLRNRHREREHSSQHRAADLRFFASFK